MSEVTATIFRDGSLINRMALDASMLIDGESEFVWIEVLDPVDSDFSGLQERFGLHALAVEDSMGPAQVPKVDLYEDQIFVVLKIPRLDGDEIKYSEIHAFVSRHHIITVRHGENAEYILAREKLQLGPRSTRLGPDFILHAIMNSVVEQYFPVVEMIEDQLQSMEHNLLESFLDRTEVTRLFRLRRECIHVQHVLVKMSDVCAKLVNLEVPCIGRDVKPYLRDVHDSLTRVDTMIRVLIDVIREVFEAGTLIEQQRQGTIIRRLSDWAEILGAPTAISGIYGMNFMHMPELDSPYAYPAAILLMLTICALLHFRFKKLRWL